MAREQELNGNRFLDLDGNLNRGVSLDRGQVRQINSGATDSDLLKMH